MDEEHHNRSLLFLTKGSQVEVTSGEDGIHGAWYVATVIHPPPAISSANHRTGNNLVYVEYHNLSSEDGSSSRLRGYADISYVRPSPVPDTNPPNFRLFDPIDAFYRNGWRMGLITTVIDDSNFVVRFPNPVDYIQFHRSDLRIYRRWVGGKWLQRRKQSCSQTQTEMAELMFTVGKKVEVFYEGENLRYCWLPATVVKNFNNNTVQVEFQHGGEATLQRVVVNYSHIRPSPPHMRDTNFVLLDKVDAYYDFGWRSGVITKLLAYKRYNVLLKHKEKEKEFIYSSLRPRMEWKGGKWFYASQGDTNGRTTHSMLDEQNEQTTPNIDKQSTVASSMTKNHEILDNNDKGSPPTLHDEIMNDDLSQQTNRPSVGQSDVFDSQVRSGVDAASVAPKRKRGRPPKLLASIPKTPVTFHNNQNVVVSQKKVVGLTTTKSMEENQGPVKENYSAEKGKQPQIVLKFKRPAKVIDVDSPTESNEKPDDTLEKDSANKTPEASIVNSLSDDQLHSRWFEDLPFVRSTPVWKTIESLEAFQKFPQKPHFRPLLESAKESAREGLAIGTMVTFSTVFDKTCGLRLDDPVSMIEDCRETLVEFENNGFEVKVIRDRLTRLLLLKNKHEELAKRSKGVVEKIEEHNVQGKRIDEEIEVVNKQIWELEEKRKQLLLKKEKCSLEFGVIEAMFGEIEQQTRGVGATFDLLVAAPLVKDI